jgi:hypothetical protein
LYPNSGNEFALFTEAHADHWWVTYDFISAQAAFASCPSITRKKTGKGCFFVIVNAEKEDREVKRMRSNEDGQSKRFDEANSCGEMTENGEAMASETADTTTTTKGWDAPDQHWEMDDLSRLASLRKQELLSAEEFALAKSRLDAEMSDEPATASIVAHKRPVRAPTWDRPVQQPVPICHAPHFSGVRSEVHDGTNKTDGANPNGKRKHTEVSEPNDMASNLVNVDDSKEGKPVHKKWIHI